MILGNLYRAKGQVGRAINVHQALLQRPDLTKLEQAYVQLCLALDFRHGGSSIARSRRSRKSSGSIRRTGMRW
jgi:lipopolysaccharide biosynthesis regulator YciM